MGALLSVGSALGASSGTAPSSVCWPQFGQAIRAPAASSGNSRWTPQSRNAWRKEGMDNRARIVEAALSMKATYYLEVISSWCHWAEPAWAELKQRYAGQVEFGWKIAQMPAEAYPVSKSQCDWFYRRSGSITRSPYMLNSGWFEPEIKQYLVPNLI